MKKLLSVLLIVVLLVSLTISLIACDSDELKGLTYKDENGNEVTVKKIKKMSAEGFFHDKNGERLDLSNKKKQEIVEMVNNNEVIFYEDEIIDLKNKTPLEIRDLGIKLSFVPEDRLGMGLVGSMDIIDNMMLRSYRKGKGIFFHRSKPKKLADEIVKELEVVTPSIHTKVGKLSGGNIQKILVGREISSSPKVFMAAYPVRGYRTYRLCGLSAG